MKQGKRFDCVQMKIGIQERLLREIAELGEEEARKRRKARLLGDAILGALLRTKNVMEEGPTEHAPTAQ